MATRQVNVLQQGRTLLTAIASFRTNPAEPELPHPALNMPSPEELPLLQHWVQDTPPRMRSNAQTWIDVPPPLEMRIAEPVTFLGGEQASGPRSHWMRLPRYIGRLPGGSHRDARLRERLPAARHGVSRPSRARRLRIGCRPQPGPRHLAAQSGPLRPVALAHSGDGCHHRTSRHGPGDHSRRRPDTWSPARHRKCSSDPSRTRSGRNRGRRCSRTTSSISPAGWRW